MSLRIAVIIATKDRPQTVSNLLNALARQTILPDTIIVSACSPSDVDTSRLQADHTQVLFGPPGLTAQRNRALALARETCDIIIFFDDDFIPSRFWIERVRALLEARLDVGCVTGHVIVDGVTNGELAWTDGQSIVDRADASGTMIRMGDHSTMDAISPYGCNMAFRTKAIEHLEFDERLVLYGWLEDLDFGRRFSARAKTISTDLIWGVHLGTKSGRSSGLRFGYSQIINPWYLMKKGTVTPAAALGYMVRGLTRNALGAVFGTSSIDRWGRLKGNLIGLKDIANGQWAPERAAEFGVQP